MVKVTNNRRNNNKITGVIKGQKPSCKLTFFRWADPQNSEIEVINVTSGSSAGLTGSPGIQNTGNTKREVYIDNDITRCAIHKNKNSSSNGFTLVLKRGNRESGEVVIGSDNTRVDYLDMINPGDWVAIFLKKDDSIILKSNSSDSGLKMLGVVENVRYVEADDPSTGKPRMEFIITGRDFGKVLENQIYFNPFIANDRAVQNILGSTFANKAESQVRSSESRKKGSTPDQVTKNILNFYYGDLQDSGASLNSTTQLWYVPPGLVKFLGGTETKSSAPFSTLLNTSRIGLQQFSDNNFSSVDSLLGSTFPISMPNQGTIYEVLQAYSNPLLNEIIVDLVNDNGRIVPAIQIRQKPFSNKPSSGLFAFRQSPNNKLQSTISTSQKTFMVDLPQHIIQSTDIFQKNIGRNDYERVNAITVSPAVNIGINGIPVVQSYSMALNLPSIQRYGLRLLNETSFYGTTDKSDNSFNLYAQQCLALLSDWYMLSHMYYNGTILADGTDELVEVGQNLYIEDVEQLYHIEGISYIYTINPTTGYTAYSTEFRVSRGQSVPKRGVVDSITPSSLSSKSINGAAITVVTGSLENIRNTNRSSSRGQGK